MTVRGRELPMAIADCGLAAPELAEQLNRYRRLGSTATRIERQADRLMVTFNSTVDVELLDATIAIEQRCCPFFTLDYDTSEQRLSISVADRPRVDALDALLSALRSGGAAPTER
jgi:hypothetical protein